MSSSTPETSAQGLLLSGGAGILLGVLDGARNPFT